MAVLVAWLVAASLLALLTVRWDPDTGAGPG